MTVELLMNCPWAKDTDEIRETLNYYLRDSSNTAPVQLIRLSRHHGYNTTARFTVALNHKMESVMEMLKSYTDISLVHYFMNHGNNNFIVWSLYHPDRLPKKIEMILAS